MCPLSTLGSPYDAVSIDLRSCGWTVYITSEIA